MSRLNTKEFNQKQIEALEESKEAFGAIINFNRVLANSPEALKGVSELQKNLSKGKLDTKTREKIALAISETNSCDYCVSAHTAIGTDAGLSASQILDARKGKSEDSKSDRAVKFARAVLENQGELSDNELELAKKAGLSDGELIEIITLVGLISIGNYAGKVSQIEIDFPKAKPLEKADTKCTV